MTKISVGDFQSNNKNKRTAHRKIWIFPVIVVLKPVLEEDLQGAKPFRVKLPRIGSFS
jgi:hypothetical protein